MAGAGRNRQAFTVCFSVVHKRCSSWLQGQTSRQTIYRADAAEVFAIGGGHIYLIINNDNMWHKGYGSKIP